MNCFYCSRPSVSTCSCSSINLCADHIIIHGSYPNPNHSFSGIGPEFQLIKAELLQKIINNEYKSIQERKALIIAETHLIINRITELSNQALNIINEAEKNCLAMLEKIHQLDLAELISHNLPLKIAKKCVLNEIEIFYTQDFVGQISLHKNWRSFLEIHSPSYRGICLSVDSKHMFAGGDDHTIRMWNLDNQALEYTFVGHLHRILCVAATKKFLISGSNDRTIRLWRLNDKSLHTVLKGHKKGITCLATIEYKLIASGSYDFSIRVWSIKTLTQQYILKGYSNSIFEIIVARNGQSIISCSGDKTIKVWNLSSRSEENNLVSSDLLRCIALSQDENILYSGSIDGHIAKWSISSKKQIQSFKAHATWINKLLLRNSDGCLFSCSDDKLVKIWKADGNLLACLSGHSLWVFGLAITQDQRHIVSSSYDSTIKVWSISKLRGKFTLQLANLNRISLSVSANGQYLAYGSGTSLIVFDIFNCKQTLLEGHILDVWCTALTYDAKIVISGSADETIRIWHIEEPYKNSVLEYQTADSPCMAVISDTLAFGLTDGQVKICYLKANNLILDLGKHEDSVQCLAVSAVYIVSSSYKNIMLWSLERRVLIHSFTLTYVNLMISIQISKNEN